MEPSGDRSGSMQSPGNPMTMSCPCPSGQCDAMGQCLECVRDADCRAPGRTLCERNKCVQCRIGADCLTGVCQAGVCGPAPCNDEACRARRCQDDRLDVDLGEECIPGLGVWDTRGCDAQCRRKYWKKSSGRDTCPTFTTYRDDFGLCMPFLNCQQPPCELGSGNLQYCPQYYERNIEYRVVVFFDFCAIACDPKAPLCPRDLTCLDMPLRADVTGTCVNPDPLVFD